MKIIPEDGEQVKLMVDVVPLLPELRSANVVSFLTDYCVQIDEGQNAYYSGFFRQWLEQKRFTILLTPRRHARCDVDQ